MSNIYKDMSDYSEALGYGAFKKKPSIWGILFGLILGIVGFVLAFIWFGWQLALVIFLLLWSNNISMSSR